MITDKDLGVISDKVMQVYLMVKLAKDALDDNDDLRVSIARGELDVVIENLDDIKAILQKNK